MTIKKNSAARTPVPVKKAPIKKTPVKKVTVPANPAAKPVAKPAFKIQAATAPKLVAKKSKKDHKDKIVRDSFTMPQSEYRKIAEIKETCLKAGLQVKKSEVLRAGLKALCEKNAAQLKQSLGGLVKIKAGRPKKR